MNLKAALKLRRVLLETEPEVLFSRSIRPRQLYATPLHEIRDFLSATIAKQKTWFFWKVLLAGAGSLSAHCYFFAIWGMNSDMGALHTAMRIVLPIVSMVIVCAVLDTNLSDSRELLRLLTPLSDYKQCEEVLQLDDAYPECHAYREDALEAQGEFLYNDYLNIKRIGDRAQAEQQLFEVQAKLLNPPTVRYRRSQNSSTVEREASPNQQPPDKDSA